MEGDPQVVLAILLGLGLIFIIIFLFVWWDMRKLKCKWAKEKSEKESR